MKAFLKSTFGLVLVVRAFFAVVAFFLVRSARQITAVANQTWVIDEHLADPDYMYRVTQELVSNNTYIVGSAVAFTPNQGFSGKEHKNEAKCLQQAESRL